LCYQVFAWAYYKKNILGGKELSYDCNVILQNVLKRRGIWTMELLDKIIKSGSIQEIEEIPEDIRRVFRCAADISPPWHVRIQAQFQKYIDNAISKVQFISLDVLFHESLLSS
jgi:ribonucleoside-diphosphate reductase alpha chain